MSIMVNMITDRQEKLLNFIIKEYVKTAKPVGSALVAKKGDFDLGPASLRSEMCELEQAGYLSHLHTSGGRVPTDKAYRYFVNNLIQNDNFEPATEEKRKIRTAINSTEDPRLLNKSIAQVLSDLSDSIVITKISNAPDFYKVGLSSLFEFPEFKEMERIFEVTNIFDRFESIFDKIEEHFFGQLNDEFQLLIGGENPLRNIRDETMILAKYDLPEGLMGSLTMIGPMRMDYGKNISLVKYTTEQLNQIVR